MLEIPVLNTKGEQVGTESLDPALLGGKVRYDLLKQAVSIYRTNKRQGTVGTKSRGMVAGSTRKLYRQKGTGRARAGPVRSPTRKGGGRAFAKVTRDLWQSLPRGMRRLARNSAILAKAKSGGVMILRDLTFAEPKTKAMAGVLKAVQADRGAVLAMGSSDPVVFKSGRNIPGLMMRMVWDLNAYEVLKGRRLIFTPEAFDKIKSDPVRAGSPAQED